MKKYITIAQAAQIANVSGQTIRNWITNKLLTARKKRCSTGAKLEVNTDSLYNIINNTTIPADEQLITQYEAQIRQKVNNLSNEWNSLLQTENAIRLLPETRLIFIDTLQRIVNNGKEMRGIQMIQEVLKGYTYKEVGQKFGLSRERVRQLIFKSLFRSNKIHTWAEAVKQADELKQIVDKQTAEMIALTIQNRKLLADSNELQLKYKEKPELSEVTLGILATKVADIHFSNRTAACLKCAGITTVADIVKHQPNNLLKIRNFGRKSYFEVKDWLEEHGLQFGMI